MIYKLEFVSEALKEWKKLDSTVQKQFKKKLAERLKNPAIPSARLFATNNRYKIKLRAAGYRLVYEVFEKRLLVVVIAVGKQERNRVYKAAAKRI